MNKSGGAYRIGTGATSLMMILVILCLTALSVVSYTSARSELSIARRAAAVDEAVYAAMDQGYDCLAALDAAWLEARSQGEASYDAACATAAEQLGWTATEIGWERSFSATEKLELCVAVDLLPYDAETHMRVTSFATAPRSTGEEESF